MSVTILYIEDNPTNSLLVRRIVEAVGYTFLPAYSGQEGLDAVNQHNPDLILLDINLPDIDGYEVARRLRSSDHSYIPIIAVTANTLQGDMNKAIESGCDVYMTKPINVPELWTRMDSILGRNRRIEA